MVFFFSEHLLTILCFQAVVCARMFITSQSATAHLKMFEVLHQIVEKDTGETIKFRHIHGTGMESITADAHKGEALGTFVVYHVLSSDLALNRSGTLLHYYCKTVASDGTMQISMCMFARKHDTL
jgi:hypothetical protein